MPQKAVIDEKLLKMFEELQREAQSFESQATLGIASAPFSPWGDEDPADLQIAGSADAPLSEAFRLQQAEDALIAAYNVESPGNTGDNLVLTTQLDYVAQMERAYRARHLQSFPRMIAHTVNRKKLHADPVGLFGGQVLGLLTTMLEQGAEPVA
jgi:hypothetical protein